LGADETEDDDVVVVAEEPDGVVMGRICAGVFVLVFASLLADVEAEGDGAAPAFWMMLACAA